MPTPSRDTGGSLRLVCCSPYGGLNARQVPVPSLGRLLAEYAQDEIAVNRPVPTITRYPNPAIPSLRSPMAANLTRPVIIALTSLSRSGPYLPGIDHGRGRRHAYFSQRRGSSSRTRDSFEKVGDSGFQPETPVLFAPYHALQSQTFASFSTPLAWLSRSIVGENRCRFNPHAAQRMA